MTQYHRHVADLTSRVDMLRARLDRFSAHPTLYTRAPGVRAELEKAEAALARAKSTARWAKELRDNGVAC